MSLTHFFTVILVTLLWLIFTAPLGRALEPLKDPAMLLVSSEGKPIARRGAIKDEPVEVAKLDPLTPKAFIAIEDRRFRSHWGVDPRADWPGDVDQFAGWEFARGQYADSAARQDQLPFVRPVAEAKGAGGYNCVLARSLADQG